MTTSQPIAIGEAGRPRQVTGARLVAHQLRYDLLSVFRDPQGRFFTIALPVIFLILLISLFGNHARDVNGQSIKNSTYYVPGIATLGIIASSFVNLVITITAQRESGVLKRRRSTPVLAWALIASRVLTSMILSVLLVAVIVAIGRIAYGVHVPTSTLPAFILSVRRSNGLLLSCICRRQLHSQRGLSPALDPSDHPAALLHLRRVRSQGPALQHASQHREDFPRHPSQQRIV